MNKKIIILILLAILGAIIFLLSRKYYLFPMSYSAGLLGVWWSAPSLQGGEMRFCCPLNALCL